MRTGRTALVFLLAAAFAPPPAAFAGEATEQMVRRFVADLDASLAWDARAASISSDGGDTVVSGLEILKSDSPFVVSAGVIRLSGLEIREGGGFATARIAIENASAGFPALTIAAPKLTADAFSMPGFGDWRFDPGKPASSISALITRLAATEFTRLAVPSAEIAFTDGSPGDSSSSIVTATIANLDYGPLQGGKLAAMTMGKVEAALVSRAGPVTARFEGMSATNLDPGGLARVLDPEAYGQRDGSWRVLAESIRYGALTMSHGSALLISFDGLDIEGIGGRQPEAPPAALFDQLLAENPGMDADKLFDFLIVNGRSLGGWLKLGRLHLKPSNFNPGGNAGIVQRGFTIEELTPEGLGLISVEGLDFNPPGDGQLKIVRAEIDDIEWPSQVALLTVMKRLNVPDTLGVLLPDEREYLYAKILECLPRIAGAALEDGELTGFTQDPVALASFKLKASGPYLGPLAAATELSFAGLVLPDDVLHEVISVAPSRLGYAAAIFDGELTGTYDAASGSLRRSLKVTAKDAGTLSLEFSFGGLTEAQMKLLARAVIKQAIGIHEPGDGDMARLFFGISFAGARLRYEDNSFVGRAIEFDAKRFSRDRAGQVAAMNSDFAGLMKELNLTTHGEQISATFAAFFGQPKSLTISLSPANPVPLALLASIRPDAFDAALAVLSAKFTAND